MRRIATIAQQTGEALVLAGTVYVMMLTLALFGASQGSPDIQYVGWFFAPARWALSAMGY